MSLKLTLGNKEILNHRINQKNKEMITADILALNTNSMFQQISVYVQMINREKSQHIYSIQKNIKTMPFSAENDLCKILRVGWASLLRIKSTILENWFIFLSNF